MLCEGLQNNKDEWTIDSDCSSHLVKDKNILDIGIAKNPNYKTTLNPLVSQKGPKVSHSKNI